jgi:hypothetical protein
LPATIHSDTKFPEFIGLQYIHAGKEERHIRIYLLQQPVQCLVEQRQVFLISRAVLQGNIKIALLFLKRVVMISMHAECKYAVFFLKYFRCAVALVHIQINDQYLFCQLMMEHIVGGSRKIIQQAEALAPVAESMVRSPCNIQCYARPERGVAAVDGALCYNELSYCKARRLRKTDLSLFSVAQSLVFKLLQVGFRVSEQYPFVLADCWCKDVFVADSSFMQQLAGDQVIFQHGKTVPFGQGMRIYRSKCYI